MPRIEGGQFRGVAKFQYDFAALGGAQGTITLPGIALPIYAIVYGGLMDVITVPTGAGASIAVQILAANDLVTAAAIAGAPWSSTGLKALVPVCTAGSSIKLTSAKSVAVVISAVDLTAGKFNVFLEYFLSDTTT
jgi:hypothetical protein